MLAEAANSPRRTAAAAAPAAPAAAAASAASAASATASAAPAASAAPTARPGNLFAEPGCSGSLLIEDVERPQADVGDFFLVEGDLGRDGIPHRHIRRWQGGCRGCATRQR
jgi:hypothetical protein